MAILKIILIVVFLIAALAVTVIVLLQEGKSAGLGSMAGSAGNDSYWDKNKKYSLEGKFEKWTKIMAGLLVVSALGIMLLSSKGTNSNTAVTDTPVESTTDGNQNAVTVDGVETEDNAATKEI